MEALSLELLGGNVAYEEFPGFEDVVLVLVDEVHSIAGGIARVALHDPFPHLVQDVVDFGGINCNATLRLSKALNLLSLEVGHGGRLLASDCCGGDPVSTIGFKGDIAVIANGIGLMLLESLTSAQELLKEPLHGKIRRPLPLQGPSACGNRELILASLQLLTPCPCSSSISAV